MKTLTPPTALKGSHLRTYEKIFQHPASHNLAWRDVFSLLTTLGDVVVEPNGHFKILRDGHLLILPAPTAKEVGTVDELIKLRHFLEESETPLATAPATIAHALLVIDHQSARLFRTDAPGTIAEIIVPQIADDSQRQAHGDRDYFSGKEKTAPGTYFEPVAQLLKPAEKILVFGTGTGTSSEMEQFVVWLKKHHADIAQRITGTVVVDERHLTEPQLLAKAREYFRQRGILNKELKTAG